MFYVYSKHLQTGKEYMVNCIYETEEEAIRKILSCYKIDERIGQLGEYYYFMKRR